MNKYHLVTGIIALLAVISFFHINSYVADKNNINWLFWVIGIAGILWAGYRVYYMSKGGSQQE